MKPLALREIIDERKQKAVESLSNSYAKNRLPLEEYERLVEYIHKTESERELVVIEKIVAEFNTDHGDGSIDESRDDAQSETSDDYGDDPKDRSVSNSKNNITIFSSRNFSGHISTGAQFVSILGTEKIEVRKSDLHKRRTVLNVVSILGDSNIHVEPGIRVINNVIPILGNADISHKISKQAESSGPELIINGTALLGNVSVKVLKE